MEGIFSGNNYVVWVRWLEREEKATNLSLVGYVGISLFAYSL